MGLFAKLLGSDKIIHSASKGIDAAFFTNEEKAGHFLSLLKAYEPFKITQRLLALIVGIPYVTVWLLSACMMLISGFLSPEIAQGVFETSKALAEESNEALGTPFAIILSFYFGGGAVEGVVRAVRKSK